LARATETAGHAGFLRSHDRTRIHRFPTNIPRLVRTRNFENCRRVTYRSSVAWIGNSSLHKGSPLALRAARPGDSSSDVTRVSATCSPRCPLRWTPRGEYLGAHDLGDLRELRWKGCLEPERRDDGPQADSRRPADRSPSLVLKTPGSAEALTSTLC